jgi:hypothetical protein
MVSRVVKILRARSPPSPPPQLGWGGTVGHIGSLCPFVGEEGGTSPSSGILHEEGKGGPLICPPPLQRSPPTQHCCRPKARRGPLISVSSFDNICVDGEKGKFFCRECGVVSEIFVVVPAFC